MCNFKIILRKLQVTHNNLHWHIYQFEFYIKINLENIMPSKELHHWYLLGNPYTKENQWVLMDVNLEANFWFKYSTGYVCLVKFVLIASLKHIDVMEWMNECLTTPQHEKQL